MNDDTEIKILGIVAEEVTSPTNDGSDGSALYTVPLLLSREPSAKWAEFFMESWNVYQGSMVSRHTGEISIIGDKMHIRDINLDYIEDNKEALKEHVDAVSRKEREHEFKKSMQEEERQKREKERREHVEKRAKEIKF